MEHSFSRVFTLDEIAEIARLLLQQRTSDIITLFGPMGAGKTTLVKSIIRECGAIDQGNSPSFGLIHEYRSDAGNPVAYHLDAYRLHSEEEAFDLGLEEYWDMDVLFFIEWPEKLGQILPANTFEVHLNHAQEDKRHISW